MNLFNGYSGRLLMVPEKGLLQLRGLVQRKGSGRLFGDVTVFANLRSREFGLLFRRCYVALDSRKAV